VDALALDRGAVRPMYAEVLALDLPTVARVALADNLEIQQARIARVRLRAGAGVTADETRAAAAVAQRRQDLRLELNGFYQASVDLAVTLRLDPSVTLVPAASELRAVALVRGDAGVEQLLEVAVRNRPDLRGVRELAEAVGADRKSLAWSALGPRVEASAQESGMGSRAFGDGSGLQEQQREAAGLSWTLGLASLGQYKAARAEERAAAIESLKVLERVRGQVVKAHQESLAQAGVIPAALEQLTAAQESLRLAQVNLRAGTLTTLDVLVAEDAVAQARVRHAQAVVRYNQSQVNLTAAVGALTEGPLGVVK
jgi:outer membrane protein TolC